MSDRLDRSDLLALFECSGKAVRIAYGFATQTARLMVGIPDYETYVRHRQTFHPEEAVMTYEEFFRERRDARYAVSKGRFKACC
jgi:uncharacterized short protein YbdD (DUF466 family)